MTNDDNEQNNYILSADDILSSVNYQIPYYQRPYVWSEDLALGFQALKDRLKMEALMKFY